MQSEAHERKRKPTEPLKSAEFAADSLLAHLQRASTRRQRGIFEPRKYRRHLDQCESARRLRGRQLVYTDERTTLWTCEGIRGSVPLEGRTTNAGSSGRTCRRCEGLAAAAACSAGVSS